MKAALLQRYGSPQQFRIRDDVPAPVLKAGQVLVRNYASSVNPVDMLVRRGWLRLASGLWGRPIIGSDFCGVVAATRSRLFREGDAVWGFVSPATGHAYAELVAVPEGLAAPKPAGLSYAAAASLPLAGLTAYQALVHKGWLQAGQRVLINGCTGGVGAVAVQLAKALGAHVTGTCRGAHLAAARALGCDEVLDYQAQRLPHDQSVDLWLDTAARLTLSGVTACLAAGGRLVTTRPAAPNLAGTLASALDLLKPRMKMVQVASRPADLRQLQALVEAGLLQPTVAHTLPLTEVGRAHELLERGGFVGKVALTIA